MNRKLITTTFSSQSFLWMILFVLCSVGNLNAQEVDYFPLKPGQRLFHYKNTPNYLERDLASDTTIIEDRAYLRMKKTNRKGT